jgi:hypothetical protein
MVSQRGAVGGQGKLIRIAIPLLKGKPSMHFEHHERYMLVGVKRQVTEPDPEEKGALRASEVR